MAKKALQSSSGKIRSFAEKNKDKNFITSELYKEMFTNRDIIEDGLRQLGGRRRIRRRRRKRKQTGGSIYWDDSDPFSLRRKPLRDLGITDIRYNRLGY